MKSLNRSVQNNRFSYLDGGLLASPLIDPGCSFLDRDLIDDYLSSASSDARSSPIDRSLLPTPSNWSASVFNSRSKSRKLEAHQGVHEGSCYFDDVEEELLSPRYSSPTQPIVSLGIPVFVPHTSPRVPSRESLHLRVPHLASSPRRHKVFAQHNDQHKVIAQRNDHFGDSLSVSGGYASTERRCRSDSLSRISDSLYDSTRQSCSQPRRYKRSSVDSLPIQHVRISPRLNYAAYNPGLPKDVAARTPLPLPLGKVGKQASREHTPEIPSKVRGRPAGRPSVPAATRWELGTPPSPDVHLISRRSLGVRKRQSEEANKENLEAFDLGLTEREDSPERHGTPRVSRGDSGEHLVPSPDIADSRQTSIESFPSIVHRRSRSSAGDFLNSGQSGQSPHSPEQSGQSRHSPEQRKQIPHSPEQRGQSRHSPEQSRPNPGQRGQSRPSPGQRGQSRHSPEQSRPSPGQRGSSRPSPGQRGSSRPSPGPSRPSPGQRGQSRPSTGPSRPSLGQRGQSLAGQSGADQDLAAPEVREYALGVPIEASSDSPRYEELADDLADDSIVPVCDTPASSDWGAAEALAVPAVASKSRRSVASFACQVDLPADQLVPRKARKKETRLRELRFYGEFDPNWGGTKELPPLVFVPWDKLEGGRRGRYPSRHRVAHLRYWLGERVVEEYSEEMRAVVSMGVLRRVDLPSTSARIGGLHQLEAPKAIAEYAALTDGVPKSIARNQQVPPSPAGAIVPYESVQRNDRQLFSPEGSSRKRQAPSEKKKKKVPAGKIVKRDDLKFIKIDSPSGFYEVALVFEHRLYDVCEMRLGPLRHKGAEQTHFTITGTVLSCEERACLLVVGARLAARNDLQQVSRKAKIADEKSVELGENEAVLVSANGTFCIPAGSSYNLCNLSKSEKLVVAATVMRKI